VSRRGVEGAGVQVADGEGGQPDDHEPQQRPCLLEAVFGVDVTEQRIETEERAEHRVGRAGGDESGQQAAIVEIVAVGDRRGQHGPAERCGEDRPDAGADAQRDRDPAVLVGQVEPPREQ
jgi:hypothetical protein